MKNMGNTDRMIRTIVAIIIGVLYYLNIISGVLSLILLIIAIAFLLTSFVSTCPLYMPFKINTRAKE